jgi:hypothetical protein
MTIDDALVKEASMPVSGALKPVPQAVCRNCSLKTPAWRDHCIHCGEALPEPSAAKGLSFAK